MKKRQVFGFVVAGLLAGFVSHAVAQSATAYSSSAVGVIKKTLPANSFSFLSFPLDASNGAELKFSDTPLMGLPNGSSVMVWDTDSATWVSASKTARGGWSSFSNRVIEVGQPIFVYNYSDNSYEAIFSGEVPSNTNLYIGIPGKAYQTIANPYPVPFTWGTSAVASNAAAGSSVMVWDEDGQNWVVHNKTARGGWSDFATNVINPAQGLFFYEYGNDGYIWTVAKPYSWPN